MPYRSPEVAGGGRDRASSGAHDSLRDKGNHRIRAEVQDLRLERCGSAFAVLFGRLAVSSVPILETWLYVAYRQKQGLVEGAPGQVAAQRQGCDRVAVVALATGDEVPSSGFAAFNEILPRELHGGLVRLGTPGGEVDLAETDWSLSDQMLRQQFCRFAGEEAGMGIGQPIEL